jgi:hypothetical protein
MTTTIGTLTPTAMAVILVPEDTLDVVVEMEDGVDVGEDSCEGVELILVELEVRKVLCDVADVSEADTAMSS